MSKRKKGWDLFDASKNEGATQAKADQEEIVKRQQEAKAREEAEAKLVKEKLKKEELAKREAERAEKQNELDRKRHQEEVNRKEKEAKEQRAKKEAERAKKQRELDRKRQQEESDRKKKEAKEKQEREAKAKKQDEELRLKEESDEKKRLDNLEARKQQEEKVKKEERRKIKSQIATNGNKITNGESLEVQGEDKKKNKKRRYILLFFLLGLGLAYIVSCKFFGYCIKTPITESEMYNYTEDIQSTKTVSENPQKEDATTKTDNKDDQLVYQYDTDNDGVIDSNDDCRFTPQSDVVLITGCKLEEDNLLLVSGQRKFKTGEYIYIIDRKISKPYKLDMGDGSTYDNSLPKKYKYDSAGSYKILVTQRNRQLEIPINIIEAITKKDRINNDIGPTKTNEVTTEISPKNFERQTMSIMWYTDHDEDGKGDPNPISRVATTNGLPPGERYWVDNADDQCPTRKGSKNGCPELNLDKKGISLIDTKIELIADFEDKKPNDRYSWTSNANLENDEGRSTFVSHPYVEKVKVNVSVKNNNDGFELSKVGTIHFKITEDQLVSYLIHLADFGNYALEGRTSEIERKKDLADVFFNNSLQTESIKIRKVNQGIVVNRKPFKDFRLELLNPKRSIESKIDLSNLSVSDINYDNISGHITSFKYAY